ncbi:MAG: glycine--tRNA ligase [Candidatus Omnitrophica bacterium]|nr:glycine--tRNA ligase [Candidatus Omnitrophota bacterium]
MPDLTMEKIVSLCKRRGFIFRSSDIYGGLSNTWDYGPYGVELKNNLKTAWWKANVHGRDDIFGMDAAILMHPKVWEASGHVKSFNDPFVKCPACLQFFKFDKIWDEIWNSPWFGSLKDAMSRDKDSIHMIEWAKNEGKKLAPNLSLVKEPGVTVSWIADLHHKFGGVEFDFKTYVGRISCSRDGVAKTPCPNCGNPLPENLMSANLMLETLFGPVKESSQKVYLRPETAQGMFVNFANILDSRHPKLPFGLAQIGKSFRNEITPGNFTFRTREFEQMEIEYFVKPEDAKKSYEEWVSARQKWYLDLGISKENLRLRPHAKDELAHYALACTDIEYNFPFGWSELEGIANRSDFDLKQQAEYSGKDLRYFDDTAKTRFYPYIIEPSGGIDRAMLAFLIDAYCEEKVHPIRSLERPSNSSGASNGVKADTRTVLKLHKELAPVKVAVFPLLKNRPEIVELAKRIAQDLKKSTIAIYDDTGAIGKLYRRQDEVGTLYCITVDVQSLEDKQVTVRHRDTMQQERIGIDRVKEYIINKL